MEEEIQGKFKLRLGQDVVMNPYWRLKFILARYMCEWESIGDMVRITVGLLKEYVENKLYI